MIVGEDIEVDVGVPPAGAQDVPAGVCDRDHSGDGPAATGQEDLFPLGNSFQDLGEVGFGLRYVIRFHERIMTNYLGHVNKMQG